MEQELFMSAPNKTLELLTANHQFPVSSLVGGYMLMPRLHNGQTDKRNEAVVREVKV